MFSTKCLFKSPRNFVLITINKIRFISWLHIDSKRWLTFLFFSIVYSMQKITIFLIKKIRKYKEPLLDAGSGGACFFSKKHCKTIALILFQNDASNLEEQNFRLTFSVTWSSPNSFHRRITKNMIFPFN